MKLYCTGCKQTVDARLTNGEELYPHRRDLYKLPFWKCDACSSFVGCHWKTKNPTSPLGVLATSEIKDARRKIHAILDPLWRSGRITRGAAYSHISRKLGKQYHTGNIQSIEEARETYKIVAQLHNKVHLSE